MTTVKLGVEKYLDFTIASPEGPPKGGDVVARVRRLNGADASSTGQTAPAPRILVIPTGVAEYETIDLKPGRYVVEAMLPSGELTSDEVTVVDSPKPVEITLRGEYSPREWLSWHHLVGNIGLASRTFQSSVLAFPPDRTLPWEERVLVGPAGPLPDGDAVARALDEVLSGRRGSLHGPPFISFEPLRSSELLRSNVPHGDFINSEGPYRSYVFPSEPIQDGHRRYLLVEEGDRPLVLGVLPIPWLLSDHSSRGAEIDVLLAPPIQGRADVGPLAHSQDLMASIVVRDPVMATVIGYLGTGDVPAANAVLRRARGLLFEKLENALAAAAGGYVLLAGWRGEEAEHQPQWHQWIENLKNWFSWLPDGAIQHGWLKLQMQRTPADLAQARESFLEGYRRGIPYYSAGVRMLFDGLTLLSNDARANDHPDDPVEAALAPARRLTLHTDPRQPFTTVRLPIQSASQPG